MNNKVMEKLKTLMKEQKNNREAIDKLLEMLPEDQQNLIREEMAQQLDYEFEGDDKYKNIKFTHEIIVEKFNYKGDEYFREPNGVIYDKKGIFVGTSKEIDGQYVNYFFDEDDEEN